MADLTNLEKKLSIQVNEGTSSSPSLKNRSIGTGYWINPDSTTVDDDKLYQLGQYFAALQLHTLEKIWVEIKGNVEEE